MVARGGGVAGASLAECGLNVWVFSDPSGVPEPCQLVLHLYVCTFIYLNIYMYLYVFILHIWC